MFLFYCVLLLITYYYLICYLSISVSVFFTFYFYFYYLYRFGVYVCFSFSFVIFDYYKIVIRATSLMSCWLLWQPVAMSIFCHRFIVCCLLLHGDK